MMKYCCWDSPKSSGFLAITQAASHTFTSLEGRSFTAANKNAFLSMMAEAISGKTGYTSKAGYCYVGALESNGRKYTIALLACGWPNNKTYKWKDASLLFNYGKDTYELEELLFPSEYPAIRVVGGRPDNATLDDWGEPVWISVESRTDLKNSSYLLADSEALTYTTTLPTSIYRAVEQGDMVGKVTCTLNGGTVEECVLLAAESCGLWDFPTLLWCVVRAFLLAG
jgi:D-alanyl-D-alanine carboxypeptidase (penicillin-binding protein 5/6)